MDVLRIRWFADGVLDAADPSSSDAPLTVLGVRGLPDRDTARRTIRVALVAALSAALGVQADAIRLCGERGEAPYAMADLADGGERIHLAISHDGAMSVATWSRGAPVGIDVMAVGEFPDWRNVARDYLGPETAATLAALPASAHAEAFARAWSEREARLKAQGLPMNEWDAAAEASLAACACRALLLPEGYVGMVALARG